MVEGKGTNNTQTFLDPQKRFLCYPPNFRIFASEGWSDCLSTLKEWIKECPVDASGLDANSESGHAWRSYWTSKCVNSGHWGQWSHNIQYACVQRQPLMDSPNDPPLWQQIKALMCFFAGIQLDSDLNEVIKGGFPEVPYVEEMISGELIQKGIAGIDVKDNNNQTCLFYHCLKPHIQVIDWLISPVCQMDPNHKDSAGQTCLFYLARDGYVEVIRHIAQKTNLDVNVVDRNGQTALFYAGRDNRIEAVTELIKLGIDINRKDLMGKQALNFASSQQMKQLLTRVQANSNMISGGKGRKTGGKGAANVSSSSDNRRRRTSILLKAPDHIRWHTVLGYPLIFDPKHKKDKQLHPPPGSITYTKEDTTHIFLIPLQEHMEQLEGKVPSIAIWNQQWSLWADELDAEFSTNMPQTCHSEWDTTTQKKIAIVLGPFRFLWHKELKSALEMFKSMDTQQWFFHPVDPIVDNCPDYLDIVKKPMDLGTVRRRINEQKYLTLQDLLIDIQLVFDNCYLYNTAPGNLVSALARKIESAWIDWCKERHIFTSWVEAENGLIEYLSNDLKVI